MSETATTDVARRYSHLSEKYETVLAALDRDDQRTVDDLLEATDLQKTTLYTALGNLKSHGLVERRPLPGDARRSLFWLTPEGEKLEVTET